MQQPMPHDEDRLIADLQTALIEGEVLTGHDDCRRYSQDVYRRGAAAAMVIRPASQQELSSAMALLSQHGIPAVPCGGGMSYTGGLTPDESGWAVFELGLMNRVTAIDTVNMTVTVEAGCTWKTLYEALEGSGYRTPYWGTLSGSRATVGGGVSQNAIFWGSGQYGSAVDSVLALSVVLADGSVLETGSASQQNGVPFFRHFGPDLTGLFCADTGALGIKASVTLKLIPVLPAREYLAFDFASADATTAAMSDLARANVASECFGFDPFLQQQRMKRQSMGADVKALAGVMKNAGSLMGAVKDGARVALAGRGYMKDVDFSVQVIVEDRIDAGAQARAETVRSICQRHGGKEIENSIPKITRGTPFGPVNSMLGPEGERWLPVHGLFPHSSFAEAYSRTEKLFDTHRETSDALGVGTGYLFATVGSHCCVLEPVFFWPDELLEIHEDAVESSYLQKLPRHPANSQALQHVDMLRRELIELYSSMGAVHLQIGRSYRYSNGLKEAPAQLISAIKQIVDPDKLMNPGALGLK